MAIRTSAKLALAALLVVAAALPARAGTTTASKVDGVNFQYTAVDTNGVLTVTFANPSNFVTQINDSLVTPIPATFGQLTLSPTLLTDDIPGLSGHFVPNLNTTKIGIPSLTPPGTPNVVFDYSISFGQAAANGLTLTGVAALDSASAKTFTQGSDTFDFSNFATFGSFTLSLGTQDTTGVLIYNVLKSGNGTFTGTGQFDIAAVPEPTSIVLAGICGVTTVLVRRRKS